MLNVQVLRIWRCHNLQLGLNAVSTLKTSQMTVSFLFSALTIHGIYLIYRVYKKKLNKPEIALRLCKAPQCTKFFIEIGCLGTNNVV